MFALNLAAREEGKYRALGGHKARPLWRDGLPVYDRTTNRALCGVCGRLLTWREDKHAPKRRQAPVNR